MGGWLNAAITGTIEYLQQFNSKKKEGSSEPVSGDVVHENSDSRKLFQKFRDQALPSPRLGQKQQLGQKDAWDGYYRSGDDEAGVASTSGAVLDGNVLSLMNLSTGVCGSGTFQEIGYGEIAPIRARRDRSVRGRYVVKQMNSLESCLTAQMYKEWGRMDQYVYSSVASPSVPTVRPLLVTNGRRIISRASTEVRRDSGLEDKEMRSRMGSIELPRRSKASFARQRRSSRFSISTTRAPEGPNHSQGSSNAIVLFFLGITIGIVSTVAVNQRELDKLNDLLKKSENLVQDLQEELEMKEFSTVKELTSKDSEPLKIDEHSSEPISYDDKEIGENRTEKGELMNSIEAELEAELEKLELSMETSRLERMSKLAELDPGFVADSGQDATGTSTAELEPSNYSVPPMELSLRLHELIKSRLEARILELEAALDTSELRRRSMLYSESDRSLSTQDHTPGEGSDSEQPLVVNLSGEALEAYNEAYEEMFRIIDVDEDEDVPLETIQEIELRSEISPGDDERRERDLLLEKLRAAEEKISRSLSSNGLAEAESEEEDDEIEKLLIKQIVEKTKGSDAILNVQQILYSMKDQ